jgi:cytochrome c peroxidase
MKPLPRTLLLLCVLAVTACERPDAPDNAPLKLAPPLGLPSVPLPADNPLTPARIELGRTLFMDRRLSHNNTLSSPRSRTRRSPRSNRRKPTSDATK